MACSVNPRSRRASRLRPQPVLRPTIRHPDPQQVDRRAAIRRCIASDGFAILWPVSILFCTCTQHPRRQPILTLIDVDIYRLRISQTQLPQRAAQRLDLQGLRQLCQVEQDRADFWMGHCPTPEPRSDPRCDQTHFRPSAQSHPHSCCRTAHRPIRPRRTTPTSAALPNPTPDRCADRS